MTNRNEINPTTPSDDRDYDVAIVGGGVSGIYCAWRLRDALEDALGHELRKLAARRGGQLRVGLFEYGDRVGGRLFSLALPGIPDTPVELGGMRFLTTHQRVTALVDLLGLEFRKLDVEDPQQNHLFYLRGQHCIGADWSRPGFEPSYRLERGERARSPGSLLIEVALRHWRNVERYPERYRNLGFWNLLLSECSGQAYQLMRDAGGYETLVSNWCAADAIPFLLADFKLGIDYFALNKGFEELPRELARRFEAAGGETHFRHRLHRLDRDIDGAVLLTFDNGDPEKFGQGRRLQNPVTFRARHVVLAMPRRAIETLHPESFIFQGDDGERFESDVRSVLPQPGFKIFAAYRRPWWKTTRKVTAGRSVTDLPVRQCYYWLTGQDNTDGTESPESNSILMASYNDGSSAEFWAGLTRRRERYQPIPEACPPGVGLPARDDDLRGTIAPAPLVEALQDQLRELHGLSSVTDPSTAQILPPYIAVFRDWTQEPYGGGWHFWKIGVDSKAVGRRMRRPFADVSLHVCGEAWSSQQGWVEGALETADAVLEEHLGLPAATWRDSGARAFIAAASPIASGLQGAVASADSAAARIRPADEPSPMFTGYQNRSL